MAKYCTNCGRELQEGEVCGCQGSEETMRMDSASEGTVRLDEEKTVAYYPGNNPAEDSRQQDFSPRTRQQTVYRQGNYQNFDDSQRGQRQAGGYPKERQGAYPTANSQPGAQRQNSYQQGNFSQGNFGQREPFQGAHSQGGYQQDGFRQSGFQGQPGRNGQWFSERKEDLARHTRNIFAQIPQLIGRPDTAMREISRQNSSILGIEMVSFQAVVTLVILILGSFYIRSLTQGYFSVNPLTILLITLIMTFGSAYLEAGILMGMTFAFKGTTSIHRMLCAVGYKALIQGLVLILTALAFLLSWKAALFLYVIGSMAAYLFFVDGYRNAVEIRPDRRLYAFWLGEVLFVLAMMILLNFAVTSLVSSLIGSYLENYGGLMNGLLGNSLLGGLY